MDDGEQGGEGPRAASDDGPSFFDTCAYCGDSLDDEEWHPIVVETDEDGGHDYYSVCDDDCRAAWTEE